MKLISLNGTSSIQHDQKTYTADKNGRFEVPDHVAPALRPHGFVTPAEAKTLADQAKDAEADKVAADKIEELEGLLTADRSRIAELEGLLASATARVTELEAALAAKPSAEPQA